jgi:exopolyphosphatase / guanosine-5'-triphosphate,3'-diphosphate pyrophosphatase
MSQESSPIFPMVKEARGLMFRLDPEPEHAEQVTRLALQLFDVLKPMHQMQADERQVLQAGALLHDIGWSVSESKHHKHSCRLIEEYRWENAGPLEVAQIAAIARYHRKAHPKPGHRIFGRLDADIQDRVCKLSSLLRVADGLDRTHLARIHRIRADIEAERCILWIECSGHCATEIWGAKRKSALFEEVFGRELDIREEPDGSMDEVMKDPRTSNMA